MMQEPTPLTNAGDDATPTISNGSVTGRRLVSRLAVAMILAAAVAAGILHGSGGGSRTAAAGGRVLASRAALARPNIVLIVADDLGYGTLGSYGGKHVATPNIDSLGADGVRFTQAYVTAATCSPSRAGLMTGRYQQRFGFEFNAGGLQRSIDEPLGLDPNESTLADGLGATGYATGMVGKWHLGVQPQFLPNVRGFDEFFGFLPGELCYLPCPERGNPPERSMFRDTTPIEEPEYLTDAFGREASDFIDRNADRDFFLYVPFNAIHTPLEATEEYLDRFPEVADPATRAYLAMTSALDDAVGAILAALERNGIDERTLVIFTSDNGGTRNFADTIDANGPLALGKAFLFEGGIRVPLLLRWTAAFSAGVEYDEAVSTLDLTATIRSILGAPPDPSLDGADLVPYLNGTTASPPHDFLFWRNGPETGAVRSGDWKLIRSVNGSAWLYDLGADPGETTNLAPSRPRVVRRLTRALRNWSATLAVPAWEARNAETVLIDGLPYRVSI